MNNQGGNGYGPPPGSPYGFGPPPQGYGPPPQGYGPPQHGYGTAVAFVPVAVPVLYPKCGRATYVVLAFFLGMFGVHNFVAGRSGVGAAQLLITLLTGWLIFPLAIVGIWVLVEMFAVSTDGNGVRMS